jgi:hypothetical protein
MHQAVVFFVVISVKSQFPLFSSFRKCEAVTFAKTYNLLNQQTRVRVYSARAEITHQEIEDNADPSACDRSEPQP